MASPIFNGAMLARSYARKIELFARALDPGLSDSLPQHNSCTSEAAAVPLANSAADVAEY